MSRLAKRGIGGLGSNRGNAANRTNPPPNKLALARQVPFQLTYGVGLGPNRANCWAGETGTP